MNNLLLLGLIACILSILLVTEKASAKELNISLTESLNMNNNDKKPKDLAQKAKPQEKIKSDKAKEIKSEKPKKSTPTTNKVKSTTSVKTKPAPTVKTKSAQTTNMKTKHDTAKNSISNVK